MQTRTVCLFSLICIVVILVLPVPGYTRNQGSPPVLSAPNLIAWQMEPITRFENADVLVNVTSSAPIVNVILYYCLSFPSPSHQICPDSFPLNNTRPMFQIRGNTTFGIYEAIMPRVLSDSATVWGEVRAVDTNGQIGWSQLNRLYYNWTPDPSTSYLSLAMYILDVEPRSMNLTLTISTFFYNTVQPYSVTNLEGLGQGFNIRLNQESKFWFDGGTQTATLYYSRMQLGHPEFFPFDEYEYTLALLVPTYLNASNIRFNEVFLNASVVNPDLIQPAPRTLADSVDDSYWNITSQVQYVDRDPRMGNQTYVRINVTLSRQPQLVNFLLLYPTLSLFALLGFSVLLRGKNEVRNRLVLYLNVFVFAYGFQSSVRSLSISPLVFGGVSMIEKVGLALIPCTVILAIGTILQSQLPNKCRLKRHQVPIGVVIDLFAALISAGVLYEFSKTVVTEYLGYSPWVANTQFTIVQLGWEGKFGPLLFTVLLLPILGFGAAYKIRDRHRVWVFLRRNYRRFRRNV